MPKILYILDLYAQPFPLRFKKHKTYKSKIGLIIGILSLIVYIYFFIKGIYKIFTRDSFYIVEETQYIKSPKTFFSTIPILLHLQNVENGDDYTFNTSLYDISLNLMIYEYINEETIVQSKNINLIKCNNEKFLKKYSNFYDFNLLNQYLCPDVNEDIFLEGDFSDSSKVQYLTLKIGNYSNKNYTENYYNIINKLKLVFYVKISFPVYNSFYLPIKSYYKSFQIRLSNEASKDFYYYYYHKDFISDNGLILDQIKYYNLFDYESVESEVSEFNDDYFIKIKILTDKKLIKIKRTYKKITEMLGEVGGTISFIFSICNNITKYLLRNIISEDIINLVIDRNLQMNNKKNYMKQNYTFNENYISTNNVNNKTSSDTSKTQIINMKNLYKYSNKRYISKFLNISDRINLKWYHHLCPLEYCSKTQGNIKLNRHKDFVFRNISLEKFFEIDILENEISKINTQQMKINYLNNNLNHNELIYRNCINSKENNKDHLTLNLITNKIKVSNKYFDN